MDIEPEHHTGLRIVQVLDRWGPNTANGVEQAVYRLSVAQEALGHTVWRSAVRRAGVRGIVGRRPDIVHLHSVHIPANILLARGLRRAGIPYCVSIHGGLSSMAVRRSALKKRVLKVLCERAYLNRAAFIHALSAEEADSIRSYGVSSRIVIAPNGVDMSDLPRPSGAPLPIHVPSRGGDTLVLMFIGRLDSYHKGLDLLIEGFAEAGVENAVLVLAGPDWRNSRVGLERMAVQLGVSPRVIFLGAAFGQQKVDLLARADVFVHTSRWEGMSLSVLEAAALGKPLLVTAAADPARVLGGNNAALIVEATRRGVAGGIREIGRLERRELEAMGHRAQTLVTRAFAWDTTARVLADSYRSVVVPRR